ncbi:HlyD family efflux transporter periplasmic adaptor subunit [Leptolyngbya sp. AN03gr2]|uniref:HlyD family efflux transporter periplasmic adaptor subunit n=1 Tax=unclassified Leptolyngbya TaxID=2650499 RepID=UPI003D313BDB
MSQSAFKVLFDRPRRALGGMLIAGVILSTVPGYFVWRAHQVAQPSNTAPAESPIQQKSIAALGRLEPKGEVIQLSISQAANSNRIGELRVRVREQVKKGQIIAVLDNYATREAAVGEAQKQVEIAESKRAQIEAGAKQGEIDAQAAVVSRYRAQLQQETIVRQATVERLQSTVENARQDVERYNALAAQGAISTQEHDRYRLILETTERQLQEAIAQRDQSVETLQKQIGEEKARLGSVAEVRPIDVTVARREVEGAQAQMKRAQAELEMSYLRASSDGEVLKIHTHEGEIVGENGVVEIGQTQQMLAVAEVYESDIAQVKVGQTAKIELLNSTGNLSGTVSEVGAIVGKRDVLDTDPATAIDARVVEVRIQLDPESSRQVAGLSNAKIKAQILL